MKSWVAPLLSVIVLDSRRKLAANFEVWLDSTFLFHCPSSGKIVPIFVSTKFSRIFREKNFEDHAITESDYDLSWIRGEMHLHEGFSKFLFYFSIKLVDSCDEQVGDELMKILLEFWKEIRNTRENLIHFFISFLFQVSSKKNEYKRRFVDVKD